MKFQISQLKNTLFLHLMGEGPQKMEKKKTFAIRHRKHTQFLAALTASPRLSNIEPKVIATHVLAVKSPGMILHGLKTIFEKSFIAGETPSPALMANVLNFSHIF